MKRSAYISLLLLMWFLGGMAYGQTDTIINGKKYKMVEEKPETLKHSKKRLTPVDSEFVLNNKRLHYYNNWVTGGAGAQQNLSYKYPLGFMLGVDFNFHLKQYYFNLGTDISGEQYGFYNNYQFHLGYGKRYEDKDFHAAGFVGLSYSTGYGKVGDTIYTRKFNQPGVYMNIEIVKKITYDVGIGAQLFADWNAEQAIIGLKGILYFSNAYRGLKYKKREEDY